MNIVHIEDEPWDSGIAHYAVSLAAEQAKRGDKVWVWGLKHSPVLKEAASHGLETRAWTEGPEGWLEYRALRREMAALKPQIINAHTGSAHTLALLFRPKGAAVVRTRGDARPPRANLLSKIAAGRTAAFIAANSTIKSQLSAAFPGARVHLVPQGIEGPEEAAPAPGVPMVGILGRLDPVKGHDVLLDAAKTLKARVQGLRVFCAGEGKLLDRLRWQLGPVGLAGTVNFLGRVPDKWVFMSGCRVGVVASTGSEAVSRAALEWMAAGRPLVATRVGGLPDIVEPGVTGLLVPPGDSAQLAEAIGALLSDPARVEEMGQKGRERWQRLFSLAPFYENTRKVYEEALARLPR